MQQQHITATATTTTKMLMQMYIYTVYVYGLLETYVHIYQVYNCRTFIPIYSLVYAGTYAYIQVFFMTYHYFVVNLAIYTSVSAGSC